MGDQPSRDETDYSAFMGEVEEWIDRIIDGAETGVSYEAQHTTFTKSLSCNPPKSIPHLLNGGPELERS